MVGEYFGRRFGGIILDLRQIDAQDAPSLGKNFQLEVKGGSGDTGGRSGGVEQLACALSANVPRQIFVMMLLITCFFGNFLRSSYY